MRTFWIGPVTAFLFLIPYHAQDWWNFIPVTFSLLLIYDRTFPGRAINLLGLRLKPREFQVSLALFLVAFLGMRALIFHLVAKAGLQFDPSQWSPFLRTRPVFQALNEEMVFRALLLGWLGGRLLGPGSDRRRPALLSIGVALAFAIAHVIFYRTTDQVWIGQWAFLTYFAFGLLCNQLYFRFRHIGYGYALHLGWNLTRFTGDYFWNGTKLNEGQSVLRIEASPLVSTALIAGILVFWLVHRRPPQLTPESVRSGPP